MTISFYFIHSNPFPRFYSKHLANKHVKPFDGAAADSRASHGSASHAAAAGASSVLLSATVLPSPSAISRKIRIFQWCLSDMKFKGQIVIIDCFEEMTNIPLKEI
jgi:hypothetical protein